MWALKYPQRQGQKRKQNDKKEIETWDRRERMLIDIGLFLITPMGKKCPHKSEKTRTNRYEAA